MRLLTTWRDAPGVGRGQENDHNSKLGEFLKACTQDSALLVDHDENLLIEQLPDMHRSLLVLKMLSEVASILHTIFPSWLPGRPNEVDIYPGEGVLSLQSISLHLSILFGHNKPVSLLGQVARAVKNPRSVSPWR